MTLEYKKLSFIAVMTFENKKRINFDERFMRKYVLNISKFCHPNKLEKF